MNRKGWLTQKEIDEAQLPKVKKERLKRSMQDKKNSKTVTK